MAKFVRGVDVPTVPDEGCYVLPTFLSGGTKKAVVERIPTVFSCRGAPSYGIHRERERGLGGCAPTLSPLLHGHQTSQRDRPSLDLGVVELLLVGKLLEVAVEVVDLAQLLLQHRQLLLRLPQTRVDQAHLRQAGR